jgi:hypothetical protein
MDAGITVSVENKKKEHDSTVSLGRSYATQSILASIFRVD